HARGAEKKRAVEALGVGPALEPGEVVSAVAELEGEAIEEGMALPRELDRLGEKDDEGEPRGAVRRIAGTGPRRGDGETHGDTSCLFHPCGGAMGQHIATERIPCVEF